MVQHNNKIRSLTNIDETTVFKRRLSYVYIIRFGGIWEGGGRERSTIWLKPVIFMLLHLFHERRIKNWGADGSQFYLFRLIMKLTIYSRGITPLSLMDDINIYPLSKSQCLSQYYTPVIFGVNRSWKLQFSL